MSILAELRLFLTIRFDDLNLVSSSSYCTGSTDIPDPLSPLLPIVHRPR